MSTLYSGKCIYCLFVNFIMIFFLFVIVAKTCMDFIVDILLINEPVRIKPAHKFILASKWNEVQKRTLRTNRRNEKMRWFNSNWFKYGVFNIILLLSFHCIVNIVDICTFVSSFVCINNIHVYYVSEMCVSWFFLYKMQFQQK